MVDNGSNDETGSVAAAFCSRNANFTYVREERRGARQSQEYRGGGRPPRAWWRSRMMTPCRNRTGWSACSSRFAEMPDDVAAVGGDVYPVWEAQRPEWLTDALLRPLSAGLMWSPSAQP